MEVKTKYNPKDIVYFLTESSDYLDDCNRTLKEGEVFVCKGEVGHVDIAVHYGNEYDICYNIYIKVQNGMKQVEVHEDFCAPDPTQLGLNVTNRYYMSGEKKIS